jgi:hypothetical protein
MQTWTNIHEHMNTHENTHHKVRQGVGVVEAAVAAGSYHVVQLLCWQTEVGDELVVAVCVLDVNLVVLHKLWGCLGDRQIGDGWVGVRGVRVLG